MSVCGIHVQVVELKRVLVVKANEMSTTGMVMVHDLLVLTNDFLSEADRAANKAREGAGESLFQKMQTEEERQKKLRVSKASVEVKSIVWLTKEHLLRVRHQGPRPVGLLRLW